MTATATPSTTTIDTDGPLLHTPTARPKWMHYGDAIRILGTVAVVFGHVSDMIVFGHQPNCTPPPFASVSEAAKSVFHAVVSGNITHYPPSAINWWVACFWDSLARWAVPIYIMLSGALLLDTQRAESPATFYKKRLARLGVPLVFWSLFFMWLDVYYTHWRATIDPAYEVVGTDWKLHYLCSNHSAWEWFKYLLISKPQKSWALLLVGQPYMHMHFIFRIAGLYAFTPMLRVFLRHCPRPMLIATVSLMLALSSADSIANNLTGTSLSMFARFAPFLGFYLAGFLLRDPDHSWKVLIGCFFGFVGCVIALALSTGLMVHWYVPAGKFIQPPPSMEMMFFDFLSPIRVAMALCAWVLLTSMFKHEWPKPLRVPIRFLANTTLGLYLIHPLFREFWHVGGTPTLDWIESITPDKWFHSHFFQTYPWHFADAFKARQEWGVDATGQPVQISIANGINGTFPNIWRGIPIMTALVYVPSLIATIILMRIPYVRRICG